MPSTGRDLFKLQGDILRLQEFINNLRLDIELDLRKMQFTEDWMGHHNLVHLEHYAITNTAIGGEVDWDIVAGENGICSCTTGGGGVGTGCTIQHTATPNMNCSLYGIIEMRIKVFNFNDVDLYIGLYAGANDFCMVRLNAAAMVLDLISNDGGVQDTINTGVPYADDTYFYLRIELDNTNTARVYHKNILTEEWTLIGTSTAGRVTGNNMGFYASCSDVVGGPGGNGFIDYYKLIQDRE